MPQASERLRAKFPEGDVQAWNVLGDNFIDDKGIIRRKDRTLRPTARQFDAIDYLCDEWDYCWEGITQIQGGQGETMTQIPLNATENQVRELFEAAKEMLAQQTHGSHEYHSIAAEKLDAAILSIMDRKEPITVKIESANRPSDQYDHKEGANARQVGGDHYRVHGSEMQHWDYAALKKFDYFQGVITKYVERWKFKNGLQDLEKAQHYLEKYIEEIRAGVIKP